MSMGGSRGGGVQGVRTPLFGPPLGPKLNPSRAPLFCLYSRRPKMGPPPLEKSWIRPCMSNKHTCVCMDQYMSVYTYKKAYTHVHTVMCVRTYPIQTHPFMTLLVTLLITESLTTHSQVGLQGPIGCYRTLPVQGDIGDSPQIQQEYKIAGDLPVHIATPASSNRCTFANQTTPNFILQVLR